MSASPAPDTTLARPAPWKPPSPLPESCDTARLTLRFWRHEDAPALFELIRTSRESLLPWMLPWARDDHHRIEETTHYIERCIRTRRDTPGADYAIGMFDRATGLPVGGTGLHRISAPAHEAEIGYFVRADRRNQGLCTEATRGLISWALRPQSAGGWGLRRIHIRCAGRNLASQRVPRKLAEHGLREEGRLIAERWVEGVGWDDTLIWGVTSEAWRG